MSVARNYLPAAYTGERNTLARGYRLGVIGVFVNDEGQILICERANRTGFWQFPQGGIDAGESEDEALKREILEETGSNEFVVVTKSSDLTVYDFPADFKIRLAEKYRGQKHRWYLLKYQNGAGPDLSKSDGEFQDFKWVDKKNCLDKVIEWKLDAYTDGMRMLKIL